MLPRTADSYVHPARPFDVNVTATAGLFEAASRSGCRRVVLISSTEVVGADLRAGHFLRRDLPPSPCSLYGLTKSLQEQVAAFYHRTAGLEVAILRPAYVTDAATMTDKYGRQKPSVNWQFVDRSDIARAVLSALTLADLRFEVFYVLSHWRATERADLEHTRQRLGWQPSACFDHYPEDP
jgi:nucleoside-diphosphate-sugar epimerase